jgi:hypothetical protein
MNPSQRVFLNAGIGILVSEEKELPMKDIGIRLKSAATYKHKQPTRK